MPRRSDALDRERKRRERARASTAARSQPEASAAQSVEDLWGKLRQGARNVAGVRWQVAVSVHFLICAHVGDLPFAVFTPEGLEDLDCQDGSGARTHIQMKEVGAGAGRLTAADVADAVMHAAQIPGHVRFVLVTDGDLGSGLQFTGWDQALTAQTGQPLEDVVSNLASRGTPRKDALELLGRTHLLQVPWNVRESTELSLVENGVPPAVSTFVVSALYDAFAQSSADQRTSTADTAITHRPGDVATAITQVQSVVDVTGLDASVTAGVCSPADYLHSSELSPTQFYEGVGGAPAHIAAHLDVLRVAEMGHIVDAVDHERYALIVGPSGSGKSILLWRAARDAVLGARVVRVRRLATDADLDCSSAMCAR